MPKFITISELADQATFLMRDYQQIDKMRFRMIAAKFVFPDLQYDVIKDAKRAYMWVNKRTNSIDIPCDSLSISSVSWVDCWGDIHPIYMNRNIHRDIVDIGRIKSCACSCGGELCNMVKSYESVITSQKAQIPDGSEETFECVNRKWVTQDGVYYEQTQAPQRVYDANGEWIDTEIATTNIELCRFEMKNGCISECNDNYDLLSGCPPAKYWDTTHCAKVPKELKGYKVIKDNYAIESGAWGDTNACQNGFNINDGDTRIVFPVNFSFDRVLVRYYADVPTSEMKIPYIAAYAALCGIRHYDVFMDDLKLPIANLWGNKYTSAKYALIEELNKYTTAQLQMTITPPAYMPG